MKILSKTLLIAITLIGLFSCAGNAPYVSEVNNNEVKIDGYFSDWIGNLQTFKNSTFSYGIKHDSENLYVCIKSNSRRFNREMLTKGFYIWFDEKGKSKKRVGIKYPVGMNPQQLKSMHRSGERSEFPLFMATEFEFYTNETDRMLMPVFNNAKNIKIEMITDQDILVAEIKVPIEVILQKFTKDEIQNIGVGFELASINKREMMSDDMQGNRGGMSGPPGGRRQGAGGGRGGMGRNQGGGRGMSRPTQTTFKEWIKVDISK